MLRVVPGAVAVTGCGEVPRCARSPNSLELLGGVWGVWGCDSAKVIQQAVGGLGWRRGTGGGAVATYPPVQGAHGSGRL